MKKLVVIGVATLAALFAVLGVAPSANAYPELNCNVTVNAQKVDSGAKLKVHGESQQFTTDDGLGRAAADSVHWRATFNGEVRQKNTDIFDTTFTIPKVKSEKTLPLHVIAVMPNGTTTCEKTLNITINGSQVVTPPGLPNTGGPRLILLVGGLALVGAGGLAIRQSRKRADALV